uniref:Uncharacterized protein n=1 Tax=Biomphalaria glabrata TaxID=6526 RepID=A0A2C9LH73_BIOGL
MEGHSDNQDPTNLKHCKMNLPSWKDGAFHIGVDTLPTAFNPVVVLKKLSLTTVKQCEGFNQPLMNKAKIILPVEAATDCQPNTWYDENQSLSDISVSDIELSDGDELINTLTNKESIKSAERKKHSDQTKDSNNTDVKLTCHSRPVDAIKTREKKESQKIVEAVVQIENKKTEVEKEIKVSLSRLDTEVMSSSEEESVKNSSNAKQDLSKNVPDNTKLHLEAKDKDYLKDTTKPDLKDKNKFDCKDGGKVESKDGANVELKDGAKVELKDGVKLS